MQPALLFKLNTMIIKIKETSNKKKWKILQTLVGSDFFIVPEC